MPKLEQDANGIVTSGRFAGHHVDEVMGYLESLEEATASGAPPPPPAAVPPAGAVPPAPKTPAEELASRGTARVEALSGLAASTALRLEQDDEAAVQAKFSDYATYKPKIDEMKKKTDPRLLTQRGFHENAYFYLKSQDPKVREALSGGEQLPPASEEVVPPTTPPPAEPVPPPAAAAPPPTPRAVPPPSAGATPRRETPPPAAASKLKVTPKIEKLAEAFGKDPQALLKEYETQGVTQEQIDTMSVPRGARGPAGTATRRSVYDA